MTKVTDKQVARRIRWARTQLGFTQKELAEAVGCHALTIYRLEKSIRPPTVNMLYLIAKAMGLALEDFYEASWKDFQAAVLKSDRFGNNDPRAAP